MRIYSQHYLRRFIENLTRLVEELSAEGLQILSTNLGIHSGFWRWVASDQASDGFWLNTNSTYKIALELNALPKFRPSPQMMEKFCHLISRASSFTRPTLHLLRVLYVKEG